MTRGGRREGSGRKPVPEDKKAKNTTFKLYDWEVEKVKEFIKQLRENKEVINYGRKSYN